MAQVSFPISRENTPCAAAACGRATKSPARSPARVADVLSVNTLFWKILVTRVKRKVGEFDRGGFQGWQGLVRGPLRYPYEIKTPAARVSQLLSRRRCARSAAARNLDCSDGSGAPGGLRPPDVARGTARRPLSTNSSVRAGKSFASAKSAQPNTSLSGFGAMSSSWRQIDVLWRM